MATNNLISILILRLLFRLLVNYTDTKCYFYNKLILDFKNEFKQKQNNLCYQSYYNLT